MALRRCRRKGCHSWRDNTALWLVDRVPMCHPCMEKWLAIHGLDGHIVVRLSEREEDFPERPHRYAERVTGGPVRA